MKGGEREKGIGGGPIKTRPAAAFLQLVGEKKKKKLKERRGENETSW